MSTTMAATEIASTATAAAPGAPTAPPGGTATAARPDADAGACVAAAADGGGRQRSVEALLAVIDQAVSALGAQVLAGEVADEALVASVAGLQRAETMAHAEKLRRIGELDRRQAHTSLGVRTTADLLATRLGLTRAEAKAHTDTAAGLARLPATAQALRRGELGAAHAKVAAQGLADLDTATGVGAGPGGGDGQEAAGQIAALDRLVADHGPGQDRRQLAAAVDTWVHSGGSDHLARREQRAHAARRVWLSHDPHQATWTLEGRLDSVGGAKLAAAVDALSRPDHPHDERSLTQRRADALVALASQALDTGRLPAVAAQRPHVILTVTADALHDTPGAPPAHLDGHGPVSAATARQICCDAGATTITTTTTHGAVVDVGRTRREPTRAQRAALLARDTTCIGCHAPATRCEIHHIRWWSHGGRTDLDNLVLLCWSCHTRVHHHGWTVTTSPNGTHTLTPLRPDAPPPRHTP